MANFDSAKVLNVLKSRYGPLDTLIKLKEAGLVSETLAKDNLFELELYRWVARGVYHWTSTDQSEELKKYVTYNYGHTRYYSLPENIDIDDEVKLLSTLTLHTDANHYFMKSVFQETQDIQQVIRQRWNTLRPILQSANLPFAIPTNIFELNYLLHKLCDYLQIPYDTNSKVRRRRKIEQKCNYYYYSPVKTGETYTRFWDKSLWKPELLPPSLRKDPKHVYKVLGDLIGATARMLPPSATSICRRIDKTGLLTFMATEEMIKNTDTKLLVFISCMIAELNLRKAFTLNPQMQGGVSAHLRSMLNMILENNVSCNLLATILPEPEIIERVDDNFKQLTLVKLLGLSEQMALVLNDLWEGGIKNCAYNNMIVLRSGSASCNSTCWNAMAGSWSNINRHIRALSGFYGGFKCLKVTAGDQAQWADNVFDKNVTPWCELVNKGILPWTAILQPERFEEIKNSITELCDKHQIEKTSWLGKPPARNGKQRVYENMICGVSVGFISPETASILKQHGIFGSSNIY